MTATLTTTNQQPERTTDMTDFTRDWIAEREQLEQAATDGPWANDGGGEISQHYSCPEPWATIVGTDVACMSYCYGGSGVGVEREEDAEFIADARTSLPAALAALRAVMAINPMTNCRDMRPRVRDYADGYNYALRLVANTITAALRSNE